MLSLTDLISRRRFIAASTSLPFLSSCTTNLSKHRGESINDLALNLGVCSATFAKIKAGSAQPPIVVSGCTSRLLPRPDSIYQAASLTKPVIAYAVLRLVLTGELNLQSRVSQFFPRGYTHYHNVLKRGPNDASDIVPIDILSKITLASLLNHTSGLPNWSNNALTLSFEPGQRWQYSGEGYVLLQNVIESVTGMSISAYIDKHVFKPLGMIDSSLVWRESDSSRAESGTSAFGTKLETKFTSAVAAASLNTTAADYARFLSAFLADDKMMALTLSNPVTVDQQLGLDWAYGWGIERTANGPNLWQWGNNSGFRAFTMVSAKSKDGFVIFTNSERGMPLAVPLAYQVLPTEHNAFRFSMVG
jgi:CubicO group peptidase (beta-lactamase class C family)